MKNTQSRRKNYALTRTKSSYDILTTLEHRELYDGNLISKEDNIDSADNNSKVIISLLGSLSEMERE